MESDIRPPSTKEPVIATASITAVVAAVITALIAFGVPLTDDQEKALLGLVAVVGPLIAAHFARKRVTPV